MSEPSIVLQSVTKRFGSVTALDAVSLSIQPGEFFSVLGPSGCGKTTLLRLVGGFDSPDSGEILLAGKAMRGVPPQSRPVNTVFQNYALFPHLNVFDNVAFGLRMKRLSKAEVQKRADAVLELTHIAELRNRFPAQLSGGQKQRVALARAIVNAPAVLLLDEPLAAIDAKLRAQLQTDLRALQRELKITFVYVTHDQDEALSMSDRIVVLQSGRIAQCGTPPELYERPRSRFVASFLGGCNILPGKAFFLPNGLAEVDTPIGRFQIKTAVQSEKICLGIRRERFSFFGSSKMHDHVFHGIIQDRAYAGAETEYAIRINDSIIHIWEPRGGALRNIGEQVVFGCAAEDVLLLEDA